MSSQQEQQEQKIVQYQLLVSPYLNLLFDVNLWDDFMLIRTLSKGCRGAGVR